MAADWEGLGFNPNLAKSDSLLAQNRNRKDALTAESEIVDVGYLTSDLIINSAVTTAKIADLAVTTAKIDNNAVTTGKIAAGAVTAPDIAGSAIAGTHIGTNTIAATKLQENSITALQIGTFDHAEGTGNVTSGTTNSTLAYQANGTAGISTIATILDRDSGIGTTTHTLTFRYGILTAYGTS